MQLSRVHPAFYHLRVYQKRWSRSIGNVWLTQQFAQQQLNSSLAHVCKKHRSLLRRRLGDSDPQLQENKIVNLEIARQPIDGLILNPGQVFSFWQRVGQPTAAKGYIEGLQLSRGTVKTGIGGGLCQLANLLYWLVLHSPLTVTERHHHSFDPFPDHERVLPFGTGASVFYNYVDLRFINPTEQRFQLRVGLTATHLEGGIYSDRPWPYSYHVAERNHQFLEWEGKKYRQNEIWRSQIDRNTGNLIGEELLIKNFSEVKY